MSYLSKQIVSLKPTAIKKISMIVHSVIRTGLSKRTRTHAISNTNRSMKKTNPFKFPNEFLKRCINTPI